MSSSSCFGRETFGFLASGALCSSAAPSKLRASSRSKICSSLKSAGQPQAATAASGFLWASSSQAARSLKRFVSVRLLSLAGQESVFVIRAAGDCASNFPKETIQAVAALRGLAIIPQNLLSYPVQYLPQRARRGPFCDSILAMKTNEFAHRRHGKSFAFPGYCL